MHPIPLIAAHNQQLQRDLLQTKESQNNTSTTNPKWAGRLNWAVISVQGHRVAVSVKVTPARHF